MAVAAFPLGPLGTNSYIINSGEDAVSVDVGGDPAPILAYLEEKKLKLLAVCLTHRHFDHVYGVAALADATGAPVYAPAGDDAIAASQAATGGIWGMPPVPPFKAEPLPLGKVSFGSLKCDVLETPGHTPGGVSLYFPQQNCVFTGDALFCRSIGRTDFPGGDHARLLASINETLFALPDAVAVYPGHGPSTTIGAEKRENPFCGQYGA